MSEGKQYTLQELNQKFDEEIIEILREEWGFGKNEDLEVIGNVKVTITKLGNKLFFLENLKHPTTFKSLVYPLSTYQVENSIFIHPKEVADHEREGFENVFYRCSAVLTDQEHRTKHDNPFELTARSGTVRRLETLPITLPDLIGQPDEQSLLLEREVVEYLKQKHDGDIRASHEAAEHQLEQLSREIEETQKNSTDRLNSLTEEYEKLSGKRNETSEKVEHLNKQIQEETSRLEALQQTYAERTALMDEHMNKLKELIEEKGSKLVSLDLLDASDLNVMLGTKEREEVPGYDFEEDFGGEFNRGVAYIQAYLRNKDIFYTQSVLRDFWALLRTNDLIILAGDSGSGKTNLVKSFADAIGGVSKIIPVKPNWTSSEDLLGYYNPIEKKYLSTEFLDALREASQNPEVPYLICLDEMNLARVEYYFADFLSKLEERSHDPEIHLYSSSELSDTLKDYRTFLNLVEEVQSAQPEKELTDFISILKDDLANESLHKLCGFHEGDSLLRYHSYIRKQARGVINTPTSFTLPANVRVIGAINIDETTHYLSPKILDRAHVVKFKSPLLNSWDWIENEIQDFPDSDLTKPMRLSIENLGVREEYPAFDHNDPLSASLIELAKSYFLKLGLDFGLRTIRQARHYQNQLESLGEGSDAVLNNVILHKVLPKMTFDGNREVGGQSKVDLLLQLKAEIGQKLSEFGATEETSSSVNEFSKLINDAEANDNNVNYWSR